MYKGFRLYDTHAHLGTARHSGRRHTPELLLREMDRAGVDRSLLIPFPVVEDPKREHDEIAGALRGWPDRFSGAACLPAFTSVAAFEEEVERCAELGFRALKLQPQYQPLNPLSHRSEYVYEAARRFGLVLVVHTGTGAPFALPSLYISPARRFADVKFVLAHAGSSVYYLEAIVAAQVCSNIYIDLSSLMPHHISDVLAHVPAEKLMVGSDLPESIDVEMHKVAEMNLSNEVKHQILWETAVTLFRG